MVEKTMSYRLLVVFSILSTFITWVLISFGATVRLYGAGLACPDWPLCYGSLTPPASLPIILEVGHRYLAAFLGFLLILSYFLCIWKENLQKFRKKSRLFIVFSYFSGSNRRIDCIIETQFFYCRSPSLIGKFAFFSLSLFSL